MPIYEYRCSQCGREVEVMHAIGEAGPTACEACGGAMRKSLSLPAVHFKGSGWAKKDAAAARSKPASASGKDTGPADTGENGAKREGTGTTDGSASSSGTTAAPASADTKAD